MLDANVLWGRTLPYLNFLLYKAGLLRPIITYHVLDERFERTDQNRDLASRARADFESMMTDAIHGGYAHRISAIMLADLDDRHLVAAAIEHGADGVMTKNISDLPPDQVHAYGVGGFHPDVVFCEILRRDEEGVRAVLADLLDKYAARPASTPRDDLLGALKRAELPHFAEKLGHLI